MSKSKNLAARDRALQAVRLRIDGYTYEQVAETLGYSGRASAYNAITAILLKREAEGVDTLRAVAAARYEATISQMMPVLTDTTTITETTESGTTSRSVPTHTEKDRVKAGTTIIRAQDSLNRLFGLNLDPNTASQTTSRLLIVEADVLSNNMQEALLDNPKPIDLGEIVDVIVEDE